MTAGHSILDKADLDSPQSEPRDRPAFPPPSNEGGEALKCVVNAVAEPSYSGDHSLPLQRLSFAERYIEGVLEIILHYRHKAPGDTAAVDEGHIFHLTYDDACIGVDDLSAGQVRFDGGWEKALMLIGYVEPMEVKEVVVPTRVGLEMVENVGLSGIARSAPDFYMSIDKTLDGSPVFTKREAAVITGSLPIGFDEDAVCVVKADPQIVNRITQDGWRMFGRGNEHHVSSRFQKALLVLGAETFSVIRDVSAEQEFELVDVLVGPF